MANSRSSVKNQRTVADVIKLYGDRRWIRLLKLCLKDIGLSYPPDELAMLAIKDENRLELWARNQSEWVLAKSYDIQAASGTKGPKLREGDGQVPEGIYRIIGFNPNSSFHLSMKLNYPNTFDLKWAEVEGRDSPGSDIFIHGKAVSIGCLAMGDPAIEELFVISERVGRSNIQVIIAPTDPRKRQLLPDSSDPSWVSELYSRYHSGFFSCQPFPCLAIVLPKFMCYNCLYVVSIDSIRCIFLGRLCLVSGVAT